MVPAVERGLDPLVAGVVAAHVADDDEPRPVGHLGAQDLLALGDGRRKWLLAHDGLAGLDAREHELRVGRADRGDEHGVDVVARDELVAARGDARAAEDRCHLVRTGAVDVADRGHRRSVDHVDELAAVVLADEPGPDDADPDGHAPVARAEPAAGEVLAGAPGDRERRVEVAGVHVLLDDAEQLAVERAERGEQRRHVGIAQRRLDHRAEADGGRETQALVPDDPEDRGVDLLEVDVPDPFPVVADEREIVGPAVGDVPRVEAQVNRLRIGAVEEARDLVLRAHVAVRVRVEHEHGAVRVGNVPPERGHPARQMGPLVVGQGRAGREVAVEVRVALGQDHEVAGAERADREHLRVAVRLRLCERVLALVQRDEHGPAGQRELALRVLVADDARVRRQVAVGSELGVSVPRCLHLVQVAGPRRLERVQPGVPDAPRVRGGPEMQLRVGGADAHRFLRSSMMIATMMITPLTTCW